MYMGKPKEIITWLFSQDREKVYEIKEHHEKRSLNANAYLWVLIGKIADALRASKDEIYLMMLKRYGQSEVVAVRSGINVDGYFKYYEEYYQQSLYGQIFTFYKVYKGSSEFDAREMSILIDGVVSDAEQMGIQTLPPHEIARLKALWTNA